MKAANEVVLVTPAMGSASPSALSKRLPAGLRHRVEFLACELTARGRFVPRVTELTEEQAGRFEARFVSAVASASDWAAVDALVQILAVEQGEERSRARVISAIDFWIDNFVIETLALGAVESRRIARLESFAPLGARRVARPIGKELRLVFALLGEDRELHVQSQEERRWAHDLCAWSEGLASLVDAPALTLPCPPAWARRESLRAWLLPTYEAVGAAASARLWNSGRA